MEPEDMKDPIEVCLYFESETDRAYKVSDCEIDSKSNKVIGECVWIPKSQIYCDERIRLSDFATITMPEWLAKDKGFI